MSAPPESPPPPGGPSGTAPGRLVTAPDNGPATGSTARSPGAGRSPVRRVVEVARRWVVARHRVLAFDGALFLAVVAAEMLLNLALPPSLRAGGIGGLTAFSALCAIPVLLRRVATRTAAAGCLAVLLAAVLLDHYPTSHVVSFVVVTYTVAAAWPRWPAAATTVALWVPVMLVNILAPAGGTGTPLPRTFAALYNVLVAVVVFLIGRFVGHRRAVAQNFERRALAAEINQAALAAQAVADERRRIARELHDVVAHHMSVIGVLATGARRVLDRDPAAADEALHTIEDTSRSTLREMRRLLDVLRTEEEPGAELAPQPGLAGIETLVEQVREAGLPVRLAVEGEPVALDPGVALSVYRIVQEALTNTVKHAGAAVATVELCFRPDGLTVQVGDDGRGPAPGAERGVGHGLVGMRERVALYGGTLRTGPRPGGGFCVHATIPADQLTAAT
jgi:signal transduction histidine kinase